MQWRNISNQEVEITLESGTRVLMIDRRATAAVVKSSDGHIQVLCTRRALAPEHKRMVDNFTGHQPGRVLLVNDAEIEKLLEKA
jgi:hypothetical protein